MRFLRPTVFLMLVLSVILSACAPAATPVAPAAEAATEAPNQPASTEPVTLKMAVLPIIDTLPMHVAAAEGLFEKHGVKVEFVPVASAPERDQVLAAGQADGTLNETLSVMFFNKDGAKMQVVRYGHMATEKTGHFFIIASAQSGINDVSGLKGVEIGISQGTIIEYVTDRLLEGQGFSKDDIKYLAVPKIPDRIALLASGELKAGVMPDPAAALSLQQGGKLILDDTSAPKYGASVISFRKEVIDQHPEAIKAFLAAIEEAVAMINADPAKYASLMADQKLVPPPLAGKYTAPQFPTAGVPSEAEWNDVLAWAKEKGLLTTDISYTDSVNGAFLP